MGNMSDIMRIRTERFLCVIDSHADMKALSAFNVLLQSLCKLPSRIGEQFVILYSR